MKILMAGSLHLVCLLLGCLGVSKSAGSLFNFGMKFMERFIPAHSPEAGAMAAMASLPVALLITFLGCVALLLLTQIPAVLMSCMLFWDDFSSKKQGLTSEQSLEQES